MTHMRIVAPFLVAILLGCKPSTEQLKTEILNTDRAFSAMSKEKGMEEAFVFYAADEVIKPRPNRHPIIGKSALIKSYEDEPTWGNFQLTWEPLKVDVHGDIGYTFGNYTFLRQTENGDTTVYGNYVSIWKKQTDGAWKFVLDTGNPTPAPTKLD